MASELDSTQSDTRSPTGSAPSNVRKRFLNISIYPHRSLSHKQARRLIFIVGFICFLACVRFIMVGAWPVVIFVAFDVIALWLAFHFSFKSGRRSETLQLDEKFFTLTRTDPSGTHETVSFEPTWLRVTLEKIGDDENQLILSSHGEHHVIADFLLPDERITLKHAIEDGLQAWRCRHNPVP